MKYAVNLTLALASVLFLRAQDPENPPPPPDTPATQAPAAGPAIPVGGRGGADAEPAPL